MLHFVSEAPTAVMEMRRVARPGSVVAAALNPRVDALRDRHCTRSMTQTGELAAAWREAGLYDIREAAPTIRMTYADFKNYWAPYLSVQNTAQDRHLWSSCDRLIPCDGRMRQTAE